MKNKSKIIALILSMMLVFTTMFMLPTATAIDYTFAESHTGCCDSKAEIAECFNFCCADLTKEQIRIYIDWAPELVEAAYLGKIDLTFEEQRVIAVFNFVQEFGRKLARGEAEFEIVTSSSCETITPLTISSPCCGSERAVSWGYMSLGNCRFQPVRVEHCFNCWAWLGTFPAGSQIVRHGPLSGQHCSICGVRLIFDLR